VNKSRTHRKGKGANSKSDQSKARFALRSWVIAVAPGSILIIALVFLPNSAPWGLPAIPRTPRPVALSSELFTGHVAKVYRIAREVPEHGNV
jgi:hypothetical protein